MLDRIEQLMRGEVPPPPCTTLELKINFMKPVWTGKLRAEDRVLSGGRTVGRGDAAAGR